jgi:soluble lytic murein transglycosylase-like protein
MMRGRAAVLCVGVLAASASVAAAEILMEERDGVLYVRNVEAPAVVSPARVGDASLARSARYRDLIRETAERHALAPALVESVIRVESNFEPRAVSPKGAQGLMQLMPATAAQLGVRDVFDVRQNVEAGVRHLRDLLDRYRGDVAFALAAYNAGVEAVARHGGIPPFAETRAYVARILQLLQQVGGPALSAGGHARTTLYRHETQEGDVVYSNVPADRLPPSLRPRRDGR